MKLRWPLCWRSSLDDMRIRLAGTHEKWIQAEEHANSVTAENRRQMLLIASQADQIKELKRRIAAGAAA